MKVRRKWKKQDGFISKLILKKYPELTPKLNKMTCVHNIKITCISDYDGLFLKI